MTGETAHGRGRPRFSIRLDAATIAAVRSRADTLGRDASAWARDVIRDALLSVRTEQVDAAVAARVLDAERAAEASADARVLAAQIRPLAVNLNDLDRRARRGEPVTLADGVPELIGILREVRELLGDRVTR